MQSADAARRALEKVLASNCFAGSARLRELLARLSGAALDGSPEPKEYEIGLEVFERPPSFDPRIDSIVRVQINRLRHKLREYYATEGAADPIRVELPKGGYRPVFREVSAAHATAPAAPPASRNRLRRAIPLFAASALIVIAAAWSLTPRQIYEPARRIAVMPLQFTGSPDEEYLSDGLTDELTNQLARVPAL
ncbi:MAG TPA: hypothetical protein VKE70_11470, partial [Candidatus Solibacter sp.]|nr:hypothetical protein [Candidatus Solibacter sp.]